MVVLLADIPHRITSLFSAPFFAALLWPSETQGKASVCCLSAVLTGVALPHVQEKVCTASEGRKQGAPRLAVTSQVSFVSQAGSDLESFVEVQVLHDDGLGDTANNDD